MNVQSLADHELRLLLEHIRADMFDALVHSDDDGYDTAVNSYVEAKTELRRRTHETGHSHCGGACGNQCARAATSERRHTQSRFLSAETKSSALSADAESESNAYELTITDKFPNADELANTITVTDAQSYHVTFAEPKSYWELCRGAACSRCQSRERDQ